MARTGRPKNDNAKHDRVTIRFDEKEFQELHRCAELYGLSVAETLRLGISELLKAKE